MRESAQERDKAQAQADEHDLARGTYYTWLVLVAVAFGGIGCVPGLQAAWLVSGLCVVLFVASRGAEDDRAQYDEPTPTERATGCGKWALIGLLAIGACLVALLGMVPQ